MSRFLAEIVLWFIAVVILTVYGLQWLWYTGCIGWAAYVSDFTAVQELTNARNDL